LDTLLGKALRDIIAQPCFVLFRLREHIRLFGLDGWRNRLSWTLLRQQDVIQSRVHRGKISGSLGLDGRRRLFSGLSRLALVKEFSNGNAALWRGLVLYFRLFCFRVFFGFELAFFVTF